MSVVSKWFWVSLAITFAGLYLARVTWAVSLIYLVGVIAGIMWGITLMALVFSVWVDQKIKSGKMTDRDLEKWL